MCRPRTLLAPVQPIRRVAETAHFRPIWRLRVPPVLQAQFVEHLAHAGAANSFGAGGSLAVLMMWLYFSALVLLFGSEIAASIREAAQAGDETASQAPLSSAVTRR